MYHCKRANSILGTIQKVSAQQQGTAANLLFLLAQLDGKAERQEGGAGETRSRHPQATALLRLSVLRVLY